MRFLFLSLSCLQQNHGHHFWLLLSVIFFGWPHSNFSQRLGCWNLHFFSLLQSLCRDFLEKLETVWLAKGACLLKFMIALCPEIPFLAHGKRNIFWYSFVGTFKFIVSVSFKNCTNSRFRLAIDEFQSVRRGFLELTPTSNPTTPRDGA